MELTTREIWQDFIRNGIHPMQLMKQASEIIAIDSYLQKSTQLREDFNGRLMVEVTITKDEDQLKVLVYGCQSLLCYFMNTVYGYLTKEKHDDRAVQIYEGVIKDLKSNLDFMQLYFSKYFDFQAPVPISLHDECRNAITQLDDQLIANTQLNISYGDLHLLLVTILNLYVNDHVSFEKYHYLTWLVSRLVSKTPARLPAIFDSHLIDFCVAQNVNAPEIVTYIVSILSERLQEAETVADKREWLSYYQKQLNQLPLSHSHGFLPADASVKDSLLNWIEQENQYLAVQKKEEVVSSVQSTKLNTSVSVPVLALFTRLFKESGIITNVNLQEIFRFVASNYTTQKKESISPGNLHGKYYKVEESTKRKVTDLLLEMVKVVKRIP